VGKEQISEKFKDTEAAKEIKDSIDWKDARELFADFRPIFDHFTKENGNSSKSMVRKLLDAREVYCKDPEKANWIIQLHYFVSRNKDLKKILDGHEGLRNYFYSVLDER